jgi:hypothetical protein
VFCIEARLIVIPADATIQASSFTDPPSWGVRRAAGNTGSIRRIVMKDHAHIKWLRMLGNLSYMLGVALLVAAMAVNALPAPKAYAAVGSIWTTRESCSKPAPQDDNQYSYGQTVHIRGKNWNPDATIWWKVEGQPNSTTPGLLASGTATTDGTGYFCVVAHKVQSPEGGEYKYTVSKTSDFASGSNKHDNYNVVPPATATPLPSSTPTSTPVPTGPPGTSTSVPGGPTRTPQPANPVLIPVTGADLGGGWSVHTLFLNLGISFLGLGLILNGLARSRRDLES